MVLDQKDAPSHRRISIGWRGGPAFPVDSCPEGSPTEFPAIRFEEIIRFLLTAAGSKSSRCPISSAWADGRRTRTPHRGTLQSLPPDGFRGRFIAKTRHSAVCALRLKSMCYWAVGGPAGFGCKSQKAAVRGKMPVRDCKWPAHEPLRGVARASTLSRPATTAPD